MLKRYFRIKTGEAVWNPKRATWTYSRGHPVGMVVGELNNNVITLGFSLCSVRDRFDKAKANKIAAGRLASSQFTVSADHLEYVHTALGDAFGELEDTAKALCEALLRKRDAKTFTEGAGVAEATPQVAS